MTYQNGPAIGLVSTSAAVVGNGLHERREQRARNLFDIKNGETIGPCAIVVLARAFRVGSG